MAAESGDDAKSLAKRVLEVEHRILKESIRLFCENKLSIQGRRWQDSGSLWKAEPLDLLKDWITM